MQRSYNIALVIVRSIGFLGVAMGVMWFANIIAATLLLALQAPEWVTGPIWGYTAQGLLSGPIWFIAGLVILAKSRGLAAFVSRGADNEDPPRT